MTGVYLFNLGAQGGRFHLETAGKSALLVKLGSFKLFRELHVVFKRFTFMVV
jgi:hypothetical protein